MRIWLFHPANQLPGDGGRDSRIHTLALTLVERGHECVFWTATFSHHTKRQRAATWTDIAVAPRYTIRLIPTPAYRAHVGPRRLWFHAVLSFRFWRRGRHSEAPDCIVANDTPLGDSLAALALARRFGAPLVLDVTDEWPEHFVLAFPPAARRFANILFAPLYFVRRLARRRANAITALSAGYLPAINQDLGSAARPDVHVFYNGIDGAALRRHMPPRTTASDDSCVAIYAGTLGGTYDIVGIVNAARALRERKSPARIIVAGDGPLRSIVENEAAAPGSRLEYVGKVSIERLAELYARSDIGLSAYAAGSTVGMPDKAYDYLAAGLPIVNSITGELAQWLERTGAGVPYAAGNGSSLADAIEALASAPVRRDTMRRVALSLSETFERATQYREFANLVEHTMAIVPQAKHP